MKKEIALAVTVYPEFKDKLSRNDPSNERKKPRQGRTRKVAADHFNNVEEMRQKESVEIKKSFRPTGDGREHGDGLQD